MKTLSKDLESRRTDLLGALEDAETRVIDSIEELNRMIVAHKDAVQMAVDKYNELVRIVQTLKEEAQAEIQDYIDGRSEKWQESEKAEPYQEWIDVFDAIDADEIEVDLPEEIEIPELIVRVSLNVSWPEFPG